MALQATETISAEVLLRPKSGAAVDGRSIITSENVSEYTPSTETVAAASQAFAAQGFAVGPTYGMGFSITAPVQTFERVFGTSLVRDERGAVQARSGGGEVAYELPLEALPPHLRDHLTAVTFTPPPDFGPTNF